MASTSGSLPAPTGCYKCGRPGHWAKDCTARPSEGPSDGRTSSTASLGGEKYSLTGNLGSARPGWKSTQPGQNYKSASKETIPVKAPRTRPKLTVDMLLSESGLGYVLEKMPEMVTIKGREDTVVRDLKSLLEGYMHWHSLLLPYFSFDQFVEKVEKLGSTKRVRVCTHELREKVASGKPSRLNDDKEVEAGAGAEAEAAEVPAPPQDNPEQEGNAEYGSIFGDHPAADEPMIPVDEADLQDFFRQGVDEADTVVGVHDHSPGCQSGASRHIQELSTTAAGGNETTSEPTVATKAPTISEAAAARMEANRLQALERARARRVRSE